MSAGANDPHADIDALCEGLAVALLLLAQTGVIVIPEDIEAAASVRMAAMDDSIGALNSAAKVMARSRAMH